MTEKEFMERNTALRHAIQTGVALTTNGEQEDTKHLRTGLNANMCEMTAVIKLLIDKGIITREEYFDYSIDILEREVARYEQILIEQSGSRIKLG